MTCVRQRSAEKAVRDVKCQHQEHKRGGERRKEGNEAGEGGGRVLSAAARLPTKPKFTFGEFGLWGAWLPQTARGRFCTMGDSSAAEISTLGGGHACAGSRHRARGRPSREGRAESMRARGARARQGTDAKKYNNSPLYILACEFAFIADALVVCDHLFSQPVTHRCRSSASQSLPSSLMCSAL